MSNFFLQKYSKLKFTVAQYLEPSPKKLEKRLFQYTHTGKYPKVMSIDETVDIIIKRHLSIARFGDGEFNLCFGKDLMFQRYDKSLATRLSEILKNPRKNTSCITAIFKFDIHNMSKHWRLFYYQNFYKLTNILDTDYVYGNANVTREITKKGFENLKPIWDDRKVVFVVGKGSRFEYIEDLYGNARSYTYLYGSPKNAWNEYATLLETCLKEPLNEQPLFLISLGPTATVLAYDLSVKGYQAIDLGHLSNIYLKHKGISGSPEGLPLEK